MKVAVKDRNNTERQTLQRPRLAFFLWVFWLSLLPRAGATRQVDVKKVHLDSVAMFSRGWHPWYELKADPEDPNNLIACGSRWAAEENAIYGFVYASSDGGRTWHMAFEDKHSAWVTEQSCAFGANHTAYFVSEASKVTDGEVHHEQGRTRLFVSDDGANHWKELAQTGWADWSTTAVSASGAILSFFNLRETFDVSRGLGGSAGILLFSKDGSQVSGPFLPAAMPGMAYEAVYPSSALALADGSVVSLYWGVRKGPRGYQSELGLIRVDPTSPSSASLTLITKSDPEPGASCLTLGDYSMAYDPARNRLFAAYFARKGKTCQLEVATSSDSGRSWTTGVPVSDEAATGENLSQPSIAINQDGELGLLWESGGKPFLAVIREGNLRESPIALHEPAVGSGVSNGALWTVITGPRVSHGRPSQLDSVTRVNVRANPDMIWRTSGIAGVGHGFCAIFSAREQEDIGLFSAIISIGSEVPRSPPLSALESRKSAAEDVTNAVVLVNRRNQHFDNATGTLSLQVSLANRGSTAIRNPICLEVKSLSSKVGNIFILNATNSQPGVGAIWDVSTYLTGDRLPPESEMYSSFPLSFHIELPKNEPIHSDHLVDLELKVWAASGSPVPSKCGEE